MIDTTIRGGAPDLSCARCIASVSSFA